jgi:hypothetical protein
MGKKKSKVGVSLPDSSQNKPLQAARERRRVTPWVTRVAMMVVSPLLFFVILEAVLRLAGFGNPTGFFLSRELRGKDHLIQNDRFGWRFFGREQSRSPRKMLLITPKPAETCRVFVLGESAAFGDPQPAYGLPRMLQVLLADRFPGVRFEVVNAAMTAINSHVLLPIARDCARQEADLWVVYMGNNEVIGPFGSGTIFGPQAPPLWVIRSSLALKRTRAGQMLDGLIDQLGSGGRAGEWGGLMAFQDHQVRHDARVMGRVYSHFDQNLSEMLNVAARHKTKVIVCSVATNLRDCAPFSSQHRADLSEATLLAWERAWRAGVEAQAANRAEEALAHFQTAAEIDGHFAELQFRMALAYLVSGANSKRGSALSWHAITTP